MTEARPRLHIRAMLVVSLAALVVTLLPSAAQAQNNSWNAATACPSATVPSSGFSDATGTHGRNIDCLAWYGLTTGRTATFYDNLGDLRRDQTASFLVRVMDRWTISGYDMPDRQRNAFPDVDSGPHRANIETLAGAEPPIVQGYRDGTYGPVDSVTRAQMASFVVRALDSAADQGIIDRLPNASSPFNDTRGSVHENNIARLANVGVLLGRDRNTFDPNGNVTRGQTASIIARVLGGLVDQGVVLPPQRITGVVHDATNARPDTIGTRLPNATVRGVGFVTSQATTDSQGRYSLWMQRPDNVIFEVDHADFPERHFPAELRAGDDARRDFRMYQTAPRPGDAQQRPTQSTTGDVSTANPDFWRITLRFGGETFSASDASAIRHEFPTGEVFELGSAGTDDAWFSRNPDGTSDRTDIYSGEHRTYYRFGNLWRVLETEFDDDGRLVRVNQTPYPGNS